MIPLNENKFTTVKPLVDDVPFNNLFAKAVVENKIMGCISVDNSTNPQTAYILHPYGMSLLVGNTQNKIFNESFRDYALNKLSVRTSFEWMQTYPRSWDNILKQLFGERLTPASQNISKQEKGIIELNTRVNFKFDKNTYLAQKIQVEDPAITIAPTTSSDYYSMKGSVIPPNFWKNENEFLQIGKGFSVFYHSELVSLAFSAFRFDQKLEIGIETNPTYRGKGFANRACCALIDYCLDNHLEPIWACRKENIGSYNLALALGFKPSLELPYYRLSS